MFSVSKVRVYEFLLSSLLADNGNFDILPDFERYLFFLIELKQNLA